MGQELKIRHCVLKIKVNTNFIVRTGPNKAYIILQLKFYHHSGSSNSESQFQVLTLQVQVQDSSPTTLNTGKLLRIFVRKNIPQSFSVLWFSCSRAIRV